MDNQIMTLRCVACQKILPVYGTDELCLECRNSISSEDNIINDLQESYKYFLSDNEDVYVVNLTRCGEFS